MSEKEKKTVKEWCLSCRFTKVKGGYRVRSGHTPTPSECLQCLYDAVKNIKVVKPSDWRKEK